jgi:hypothetical protein
MTESTAETSAPGEDRSWPAPLRVAVLMHVGATVLLLGLGQVPGQTFLEFHGGLVFDAAVALQLSQVILLGTWRALGRGAPWVRMACTLPVLVLGACAALVSVRQLGRIVWPDSLVFQVGLSFLLYSGNTGLLLVLAAFRWRAVRDSPSEAAESRQFGIRHLLLAMLAAGLWLGAGVYEGGEGQARDRFQVMEDLENAGLRRDALTVLLLSYLALWAFLGKDWLALRVALYVGVLISASLFQGGWPLGGRLILFFGAAVGATLLAVRWAGYRIVRTRGHAKRVASVPEDRGRDQETPPDSS